jgi:transcriptional regulator with PAS, ATPase and Fis domain
MVSPEALRCLWSYHWPGNIRELQHVLEGAMVLSDGVILPEHLPPGVQRTPPAAPPAEVAAPAAGAEAMAASLDEALEDWERRKILDALRKSDGVQARAAKILGISERSLWYRVKKLKIQVKTPPA